jgi:amino acid adenylation domain-containing protein
VSTKNIEDAYPLSPMQEGMLFHSLLAPESGIYITQVSCRLRGIDASIFAHVWQQLIDRQTILRSAFVWKNVEKPLQVVGRHVGLGLEQQDWRELSPGVQEERFEAYLEADRIAGFNLMKAPVMRLALFQTGERDYKFLWSHHHILMDGWSVSLLLSDFFNLYKAVSGGGNHQAEHRRPYRDYIGWLQQQNIGQAEAFWRRTLKGFEEPTRLGIELKSIDADLMPPESHNYEEQHINLSEATTAGLQKLGREQQVTLNTVVQGAWALLLSRYSGSRDVVFGATVSGRPASLPGVEEMVGLFINTLPVRVEVAGEEGVGGYLRRLQEQQVEVRQYEYSPLVEVQGWSEVGRGVRLFDTILVFENYPVTGIMKENNRGLDVSEVRSIERSNYPLTLIALPGPTLRLNLIYSSERYDTASMAQMLNHLKTLLEAIAIKPEQTLAALSLLTPAEREQILVEWNQTRLAYVQDRCLHELFEAQAARTPDTTAITFADRHLTYRQLNDRANQLARRLQRLGVGAEVMVGVLMERSLEMVIALYAILKAGGAYVPLEPTYPRERLAFMLNDLSVPVILTQQRFAAVLPQQRAHVVSLDTDWTAFAGESVDDLAVALTPLNVAYVIYTSGSTGQPKGVMNTHLGICNRLLWMQEAYQLDSAETVLQKTPFSFDVSVWEFFWPLLVGARLVVAQAEGHRDGAYLIDLIKREKVTTLHFVPSMLKVFLEDERTSECESLKRVICSGEALSGELQERFYERMAGELHNLYGPTEAAVDVTSWACERESLRRVVPIGKPIANTQIYVLDERLEAVPVGVAGELFIGGVNLARGYLNRAELTAERFIPHPYSTRGGERLYRTGDIARWLADGNIEYLGRIDQQVKIRGFRIELEEIRVTLLQHPDIKEAVISTRGDSTENHRLVAYLIAAAGRELSSGELRDYVKERLPEYMVPSVFVMLEKLPLTPNGKVDYRALPRPEGHNVGLKNEYVAPRTDVEQLLRNIWHEVTGIEKIGVHDNFFDLGGHSILMLKVQRKIREAFQRELSLVELFKYPTIHLLAECLRREPDAPVEPPSFQRSFDRAQTRRELVNRQREARKRNVAAE